MGIRRGRVLVWLVAVLVMNGCGSDGNDPDETVDLTGQWNYQAVNLTNAGYAGACRVSATTMSLSQTADSVHGVLGGSFLICVPNGGVPDTILTIPTGLSVRGAVSGSGLTFEIDGEYWAQSGEFSADDMSGTMSLTTAVVTSSFDTFTGAWEAARLLPP